MERTRNLSQRKKGKAEAHLAMPEIGTSDAMLVGLNNDGSVKTKLAISELDEASMRRFLEAFESR
jgi:hypothetical protein